VLRFAPAFPPPSDHTDCSLLNNHFSLMTVQLAVGSLALPKNLQKAYSTELAAFNQAEVEIVWAMHLLK